MGLNKGKEKKIEFENMEIKYKKTIKDIKNWGLRENHENPREKIISFKNSEHRDDEDIVELDEKDHEKIVYLITNECKKEKNKIFFRQKHDIISDKKEHNLTTEIQYMQNLSQVTMLDLSKEEDEMTVNSTKCKQD